MYGKHFESMYDGSMYGAGVTVFAVWGYVIARTQKGCVELNPKKLADTLGGEEGDVIEAIKYLERPDPKSRFKEYEGRRLVKEGEFQYMVPSWEHYRSIRDEEARREYNRDRQRERRARLKKGAIPKGKSKKIQARVDAGEKAYLKAEERGDEGAMERAIDRSLPDELS